MANCLAISENERFDRYLKRHCVCDKHRSSYAEKIFDGDNVHIYIYIYTVCFPPRRSTVKQGAMP